MIDTAEIRRTVEWYPEPQVMREVVPALCDEVDCLRAERDRLLAVRQSLESELAKERRRLTESQAMDRAVTPYADYAAQRRNLPA